ncbi:interactor of constitutive active ROPs 4-like isoform X2 [Primulina tabacum]|uniref:interactor of constitutive active ROPs 4-like isoform X2 n=1 Tax=Primulina tabacum TaxID=48773 RepID=UPI003F599CFB
MVICFQCMYIKHIVFTACLGSRVELSIYIYRYALINAIQRLHHPTLHFLYVRCSFLILCSLPFCREERANETGSRYDQTLSSAAVKNYLPLNLIKNAKNNEVFLITRNLIIASICCHFIDLIKIHENRLTEVPQKQTPRGPPHLRTSSSASDPLHNRVRTERSPKIAEGRSPRGAQSDPVNKKKLGTRIADLESQLGQAQDELKSLKDQLVSADAAKKVVQEHLEKKAKKQQNVTESMQIQEKHSTSIKTEEMDMKNSSVAEFESSDEVENETDVFEVPMETKTRVVSRSGDLLPETPVITEPDNSTFDELGSKNDEINLLKTKLDEKDKEMDVFRRENQSLRNELNEKSLNISSAQSQIAELILKLNKADQELENSKNNAFQINEKLIAAEKAKEELESEMKLLRVQTEQWRKAADAAAAVLAAGGVEMNGRRISERCGSMDNHYRIPVGVYPGYADSPRPMDDESDDVFEGGKRKGSGIRMFGDLWKKKGQK